MLEEYDKLENEITKYVPDDMTKAKELVTQKQELIKKMNDDEIQELLNRPYPAQYKAKIKELRGN